MRDVFSEYLDKINKSNDFPLFNLFDKTEQDNLWHSEGNVRIHTNMVVNYPSLKGEACRVTSFKSLVDQTECY